MTTSHREIRNSRGSLGSVYGPCMCHRCAFGPPRSHSTTPSMAAWIRAIDNVTPPVVGHSGREQTTIPIERVREGKDIADDVRMIIQEMADDEMEECPPNFRDDSLSRVHGPCMCRRCTPESPRTLNTSLAAFDYGRLQDIRANIQDQDMIPIDSTVREVVQQSRRVAFEVIEGKDNNTESSERWQSMMVRRDNAKGGSLIWMKKEHKKEYSAPSA